MADGPAKRRGLPAAAFLVLWSVNTAVFLLAGGLERLDRPDAVFYLQAAPAILGLPVAALAAGVLVAAAIRRGGRDA